MGTKGEDSPPPPLPKIDLVEERSIDHVDAGEKATCIRYLFHLSQGCVLISAGMHFPVYTPLFPF